MRIFARVTEAVEYLESPLGWMAVRQGLCWCDECCRKNARGYGKTKEEALGALVEEETNRNSYATN